MKHLIALSLFVPLLTACGGGDKEPPIGPFSASISARPALIVEGGSASLAVTVQNVKTTANITLESSIPQISITRGANNTFELQAAEVDREFKGRITLTAIDGTDQTRRVTSSFDVTVENSSFTATLLEIAFLQSQRERLVQASEEQTMLAALQEITQLLNVNQGLASSSPKAKDSASEDLSRAIQSIQVNQYNQGQLSDSVLIADYQHALVLLEQHMALYRTALNNQFGLLAEFLPRAVQAEQFILDPSLQTASFFTGNPMFGQVVEQEWLFNDDVTFLVGLADSACGL